MPWIKTPKLSAAPPELHAALRDVRAGLPPEYSAPASERVPESVRTQSIVMAHGLVPEALKGFFGAYNAFFSPELPLCRREQELIATVVSLANDCFY